MRGLKSGQPTNMQAFVYYRLRCILAGDLAKAWGKFGGLTAQLNFIGVVLRLAITESPFVAMEYGRVMQQRLAALARDRYMGNPGLNFMALLANEQTEVARNIVASPDAFLRNRSIIGLRPPPPPQKDYGARASYDPPPKAPQPGDQPGANEVRPKFGYGDGKGKK